MITERFDAISQDTIERLIDNHVSESKYIDYKLALPGKWNDEARREFLADVSSFANAGGGHILYGIEEDRDESGKSNGLPKDAHGLPDFNSEFETLRLQDIVKDGIRPRIPGIQIKPILGFPNGPVLVIHIPKSWQSPHMVTFKGSSRFYSRKGAAKYTMDVDDLSVAFRASGDTASRIQAFRDARLARIIANEGPIPLGPKGKIVLHLVPVSAMETNARFSPQELQEKSEGLRLWESDSYDERFNLEGWLRYTRMRADNSFGCYYQLFRNGIIEAVDANLVGPFVEQYGKYVNGARKDLRIACIRGVQLGQAVIKALEGLLDIVKRLNMYEPIYLFLALTNVHGAVIVEKNATVYDYDDYKRDGQIDRDILVLPEVEIKNLDKKPEEHLRIALDALWQSSGSAFCPHYDEQGNWRPRA